jgi:hypothetical protein
VRFFADIGFPHADDVTTRVTRHIDNGHQTASQMTEADDRTGDSLRALSNAAR